MPVADFSLKGKVAIVTGASRGIGRSIALGLAEHGASVALAARKPEPLLEALAAVQQQLGPDGRAIGVATNVRRPEELRRLVEETERQLGRVDILVNNAATNPSMGPIQELDERAFDTMMNTNVKAAHLLSNLAREAMLRHDQGGSIVNVSSTGGLAASDVLGGYSVSKAALIMLTRVQAKTWGRDGIRVNCIAPGLIRTEFSRALWSHDAIREELVKSYALGRMGSPDEMAGAVVYLASPAASFVTGQTLVLDGGGLL